MGEPTDSDIHEPPAGADDDSWRAIWNGLSTGSKVANALAALFLGAIAALFIISGIVGLMSSDSDDDPSPARPAASQPSDSRREVCERAAQISDLSVQECLDGVEATEGDGVVIND